MGNQSNCSVVFTLFKVTFLGMWDECGERLFLWPLTSFPDRHTYSVHSVQCCLSWFEHFCWDVITHQLLWLCDLLSDGSHKRPLNEVVEALSPNILLQFHSLPHRGTGLHSTLSTCLRFVQLQSNDWIHCRRVVETFESLILTTWKTCLEFPFAFATCLPAAAELFLYLCLQFLISVLIFSFCFSLFPDYCVRVIRYPFLFLLRLDVSNRFSGHFEQDCRADCQSANLTWKSIVMQCYFDRRTVRMGNVSRKPSWRAVDDVNCNTTYLFIYHLTCETSLEVHQYLPQPVRKPAPQRILALVVCSSTLFAKKVAACLQRQCFSSKMHCKANMRRHVHFMAALRSRCGHYIFAPCGFFFLSSFFLA